ncbi:hypothetical protein ACQR1W_31060 [Bradyrhizobium sp. HKCCYLS1011]|uniref:hypothetical protein n=1 Tax=Bradyrhizobium sp. HKCCYLS1011 TaxID=3420733 RepID=UPI003EBDB341
MHFKLTGNGGNCSGCEWLQASGEITLDSAEQLKAYLESEKLSDWQGDITFDSPGGSLFGGIKLGTFIRKQGMSTSVGGSKLADGAAIDVSDRTTGVCASACVFAYLGGVQRTFGRLGVHQFYDPDAIRDPSAKVFTAIDYSDQQMMSALISDYVTRMGADARLMLIVAKSSPAEMHYFSEEEARGLRVTWEPNKFDAWAIELRNQGVVAFSKTADRQKTVTLFCRGDRIPRALVTMPIYYSAQNTISLFGEADYQAFGVSARGDRTRITFNGNVVLWEINLSGVNPNRLSGSIGLSDGSMAEVRAFASVFTDMSAVNLSQAARIAFRNCI